MRVIESKNNYVNLYVNPDMSICFSYGVIIALKTKTHVLLIEGLHNYSKTTAKHRNYFLGLSSKEVKDKTRKKEIIIGTIAEFNFNLERI